MIQGCDVGGHIGQANLHDSWYVAVQVASAKQKLEARLKPTTEPLDYYTTLRIVRDALAIVSPAPVVISEGANTMDNSRSAHHLTCHDQDSSRVDMEQFCTTID